jgi:hypothetical protein
LVLKHGSPEEHHVIAIHDPAAAIHSQHPIRVAIKGKTHHSASLFHSIS